MLKEQEFLDRLKSVGPEVCIYQNALLIRPEIIEIGKGTRIDDFCRIEGGAGVIIGEYCHISSFSGFLGGGNIELGNFVGIAQGARMISGRGHPFQDKFPYEVPFLDSYCRDRGYIKAGDYAFVGANAVVLPNVTLGEGATVGANAVVTKDVPPWAVVLGAPAKIVGYRHNFVGGD